MLCRSFLVWYSPVCLFLLISLAWGDLSRKILLRLMSKRAVSVSSSSLMVLSLFKSLIRFELGLVYGVRSWSTLDPSSVPNTIYLRHYPFSIGCALFLCFVLIVCTCMGLFLDSQFYSIDLCICFSATTMLFWLLWFCNIVWNQGVWYLQLCSFHSGLFWLFWGLSWLHINLRIFCLISVEKYFWNFSEDCIESIACVGNMDILTVLTLSVHEQTVSFCLFVPSSVSFQCVLEFSVYRFFTTWLNLFINIVFFLFSL